MLAIGLLSSCPAMAQRADLEWNTISPGGDGVADATLGCSESNPDQGAATVDESGNSYLVGCSQGDFLTVKFAPDGSLEWVRRLKRESQSNESASEVAVASDGTVYVAGRRSRTGQGNNAVLAAYAGDGSLLWTAEYNREGNGNDIPKSLIVDSSGNIYLLVGSFVSNTGNDLAVLKYNPLGQLQWDWVWDSGASTDDNPAAFAMDAQSNIYLTGTAQSFGPQQTDIQTVKLNASGEIVWTARFAGPAGGDDVAEAIAVTPQGDVRIVGSFETGPGMTDGLLLAYDSQGQQQWSQVLPPVEPVLTLEPSIALDSNHNVIVGVSVEDGPRRVRTSKYSANGDFMWSRDLTGANIILGMLDVLVDENDLIYAFAQVRDVDFSLNILVAQYDEAGNELAMGEYDSQPSGVTSHYGALAIRSGSVVHSGSRRYLSRSHYAVVQFDLSGTVGWESESPLETDTFDEALAPGHGRGMVVDANGHVYVAGLALNGRTPDYRVIKYGPDGGLLWARMYNGDGDFIDQANAIAVGQNGEVYVAGQSNESGGGTSCTTVAYSADGERLWRAVYAGPGADNCGASGIAVSNTGNVNVVGRASGQGVTYFVTLSYTPQGQIRWETVDVQGFRGAEALRIDQLGRSYVWGSDSSGYTLLVYDDNGLQVGSALGQGIIFDGVLHPGGGIALAGQSLLTPIAQCMVTRLAVDGSLIWEQSRTAQTDYGCRFNALSVNAVGDIYAAGVQQRAFGSDAVVARWSGADGSQLWSADLFNSSSDTVAWDIALNAGGTAYAVTTRESISVVPSLEVIEVGPSGNVHWIHSRIGSDLSQTGTVLAIAPDGNPVISGDIVLESADERIQTFKLSSILYDDGFE